MSPLEVTTAVSACIPQCRPCEHNRWTKQTKKRGKLVLKCETCGAKWKVDTTLFTKCKDFRKGQCLKGDRCEHPHIFAREEYLQTMRRRDQLAIEKKRRRQLAEKEPAPLPTAAEASTTSDSSDPEGAATTFSLYRYDPYSMCPMVQC